MVDACTQITQSRGVGRAFLFSDVRCRGMLGLHRLCRHSQNRHLVTMTVPTVSADSGAAHTQSDAQSKESLLGLFLGHFSHSGCRVGMMGSGRMVYPASRNTTDC